MKFENIFLLIVFPLAYLISILLGFEGLNKELIIIIIIPALAAIVSLLLEFKSFKGLLKPFFHKISCKSLAFTIVFPIISILFCMLAAIYTHQGALLTNWSNVYMTIANLILISTVFFISGLFEEYGWRGYLFPRLSKKYSFKRANLIIGIIVVCYNLPLILISNSHYGVINDILYTSLQSAAIFAMNYAFTFLFTLSKNVILPSIMRALWNNLNLAILGYSYKIIPVQGYIMGKPHIINGQGLFGLIFFSTFALYAYKKFANIEVI